MSNTATAAQIAFYTKLVNKAVTLDASLAGVAQEALSTFPGKSVVAASEAIDRAKSTVARLTVEAPTPTPSPTTVPTFHVHPGVYTVVSATGRRTFKVEVQASDAKFAPGQVVVSFLSGQDNDGDYTGFAFLVGSELRVWGKHKGATELLAHATLLVADPDAALVAKHCARCGRTLTTPESIAAGLGPECQKRGLR